MAPVAQENDRSAKRRRTTTTPAPRKRARLSIPTDDDVRSNSSKKRRGVQYTLTQIDFVKSSPYDKNENEMLELEPLISQPRVQRKRAPMKKRDSTLTQMDFFGSAGGNESSFLDDAPLQLYDTSKATVQHRIPSFDGTVSDREVEALQETRMPPPQSSTGKPRARIRSTKAKVIKSEEQQPRKRRKMDKEGSTGIRRTDPVEAMPHTPSLVIQDSTDFDEFSFPTGTARPQRSVHRPSTPPKNRDRIPSSQTPESILPSTRKRTVRPPLAEVSTNIQISPSKSTKNKALLGAKPSSPKQPSRRSKICVLKIPPRALLPRTSRQDDSQQDIWSLHATSSPRYSGSEDIALHNSVKNNPARNQKFIGALSESSRSESLVVEESSNARLDFDTQKSLPDLSEVFPDINGPKRKRKSENNSPESIRLSRASRAAESHKMNQIPDIQRDDMLLAQEPVNMIPELEQVESDSFSDLGDPIANDTQYVNDLQRRVSSPMSSSENDQQGLRAATKAAPRSQHSPMRYELPVINNPASPVIPSPLPAPKLVASPNRIVQQQASGSTLRSLPSLIHANSTQHKSSERVTITQVPLNDTNEHRQLSSSSPTLPPAPRTVQKFTFPASLPRPSQVSTQAPSTQGFFPTSPTSESNHVTNDSEIEAVTIKDSSSFSAHLSQFPSHRNTDMVVRDDLDTYASQDSELDLDPSTFQRPVLNSSPVYVKDASQKEELDEVTQTPTQRPHHCSLLKRRTTTQSSPILLNATTRSQRDAELDVIALPSSPQEEASRANNTPRASLSTQKGKRKRTQNPPFNHSVSDAHSTALTLNGPSSHDDATIQNRSLEPPSSSVSSSNLSPSPPRTLKRKYSPIPGFDNETQSDYTQGGHVTAAYIHRAHEEGWLPKNYIPKPYKVKNWSRSMYEGSKSKKVKDK